MQNSQLDPEYFSYENTVPKFITSNIVMRKERKREKASLQNSAERMISYLFCAQITYLKFLGLLMIKNAGNLGGRSSFPIFPASSAELSTRIIL